MEAISLPELFHRNLAQFADKPATHFAGRTLTFAQFDQASHSVATALAARGIAKGDRVGLYCPNSDAFAIAYFGILNAGATVVPLNLLLNPKEVAFILNDAGAKSLLYHEAFAPAVAAVRASLPGLAFLACIGATNPLNDLPFANFVQHPPLATLPNLNPAEDLVAIIYTSGTTGRPKGAMLTHRNLFFNTLSVQQALQLQPGQEIFITVLPMFHAFAATACMLSPLLYGNAIVPLPKFDPGQVADAIAATHATVFCGVPSMFNSLLRLPEAQVLKFACLRYAVSGGAALPVEVLEQFEKKFGKVIYEGDGPTECSPVTCVNPIGGRAKPGTVGLPVPFVEMQIRDDAGTELPRGQIGEICVRGPNVMKGYWNLPDDTRDSFFGDWFRTGDLGCVDQDGYFSIVDRKKDMIIVNGMNVYPRIIEELLYKHPAVREAAVVGEPDELHGEIPVAFVAPKEGAAVTAA
ncbi:MAG: long-chain fatty acid--CoA ligase, partial [Kiritimatiellaeota bacterium]|nr:long-chain fatty acid--CoA ligase [Kiritimatiellota bacterium]